jgi:hypothetical protein
MQIKVRIQQRGNKTLNFFQTVCATEISSAKRHKARHLRHVLDRRRQQRRVARRKHGQRQLMARATQRGREFGGVDLVRQRAVDEI